MEKITSLHNSKIKQLKHLEKAGERKEQKLFVIEGVREVVLAYRAGYKIESLFICPEIYKEDERYSVQELLHAEKNSLQVFSIPQDVYCSVTYRESTEGVIAMAQSKALSLQELKLNENCLILVMEGVEKPGNLGAMLRTADAAGVDAVIICEPRCDIYNPNVIRSGIGTVFTNQLAVADTTDAIAFLQTNKIQILTAEPEAKKLYNHVDCVKSTAIVVGTESTGLSSKWNLEASERIRIPMHGKIDSMNVSVSTGILLFEAIRQRSETEKQK